jgi:carboxyl-terminal processing protease
MTDADYWRTAKLDLAYAKHFISSTRCYSSAKYFFSCIQAVNAAGGFLQSPIQVVPDDRIGPDERELSRVPALVIVDHARLDGLTGKSARERAQSAKEARRHLIDASAASFARVESGDSRIDFESVLRTIQDALPSRVPVQKMLGAAISAHLRVFDAHATIIPTTLEDAEYDGPERSFVGIGVTIRTVADGARVNEIFPGAPAELAGLHVGDVIIGVAREPGDRPQPAAGKQAGAIAELIDGRAGTSVALAIKRGRDTLHFVIPRAPVHKPSVTATVLHEGNHLFGYLRIWSFESFAMCDKVENALERFQNDNAKGVILDLRQNPGGQMRQGICVAGLFLGLKTVLGIKSVPVTLPGRGDTDTEPNSEMDWLHGHTRKPSTLPLVVIIDGGSASASEIVAGALQFYERGWLVGERSYGKASVQTLAMMEDNDTLTLSETTARFYRPDGLTIQRVGIAPDFLAHFREGASPDEFFTLREADDFPDSLPSLNNTMPEFRPKQATIIKACADKQTREHGSMRDLSGTHDTADYQKIYAVAVLECSLAQASVHQIALPHK